MDKNSYISCWIELPPSHEEVFKKIVDAHKIDEIKDLVVLSENEFKNIEGITPLMLSKTKEILQKYGYQFGMTKKDIMEAEDKRYFETHKADEEIARGEAELIKDYMENGSEMSRVFVPEIMGVLSRFRNNSQQLESEPTETDDEEDIYAIEEEEEEPIPTEKPHRFHIEVQTEEEINARKEAESKKLQNQIDRRKARAYNYTSPIEDCVKGDLEWFRFWMIVETLRDESWFYKLTTPYTERVHRAIIKGNYLFKKWLEDAKERYYDNKIKRDTIYQEISELSKKMNNL